MKKGIEFTINGRRLRMEVEESQTLLQLIREELNLTGTKRGCDRGDCGACTVLLNGKPVNSCLVLAAEVADKEITTIEGLSKDGRLHPLQESFVENDAIQCGFCTPGMIMTALALLSENPDPTEDEIRSYLEGNLCRCTGYGKIIKAVKAAAGNINR